MLPLKNGIWQAKNQLSFYVQLINMSVSSIPFSPDNLGRVGLTYIFWYIKLLFAQLGKVSFMNEDTFTCF